MTKKLSDEELAKVSGAGERDRTSGGTPEIEGNAEPGSGPGGPAEGPDTAAPGNDPAVLDRE